jgi:hypothetical protein
VAPGWPSTVQPTVVSRPSTGSGNVDPMFISTKLPVP